MYVKHSDVLVGLTDVAYYNHRDKLDDYCIFQGITLVSALRMVLQYYNDIWSKEVKYESISVFKDYIDTTDLETEFLS